MRFRPSALGAVALTAAGTLLLAPATQAAQSPPSAAQPARTQGNASPESAGPVGLVDVEGTTNFRDLGGYRIPFGAEVKKGTVYRADALAGLSDDGLRTLTSLGVERVVDYRTATEVESDGKDRLPAGLEVTRRPVDTGDYTPIADALSSHDPELQEQVLGDGAAAAYMRKLYRGFVSDSDAEAAFARTLRELADPSMTPLVFHCSGGKDRTGWTSYLLLRALGVPHRTAVHDYLLSNEYRAKHDAAARRQMKEAGVMQHPDLMIPLMEVRVDYLKSALAQVRRDYTSVRQYLHRGLGIDERTMARLRQNLLTHR